MGSSVTQSSTTLSSLAGTTSILQLLTAYNITELDTARVYNGGKSEELLGQVRQSDPSLFSKFKVSTKAPAWAPGSLAPDSIRKNCEASLKALGLDKCDIYYLHGPDRTVPLVDQCRTINDLYTENKFTRFGVSNLPAHEVKEIHEICTSHGWVVPTVYQGGYNPLGRAIEVLFPVLRELKMNFYAFSPLAGGFLAKPIDQILKPEPGSRFDVMKVFGEIYLKEPAIESRHHLEGLLRSDHDLVGLDGPGTCTLKEATLRWMMHHSMLGEGDAIILGARDVRQAEENLKAAMFDGQDGSGDLTHPVQEAMNGMWDSIKEGSWPYHS